MLMSFFFDISVEEFIQELVQNPSKFIQICIWKSSLCLHHLCVVPSLCITCLMNSSVFTQSGLKLSTVAFNYSNRWFYTHTHEGGADSKVLVPRPPLSSLNLSLVSPEAENTSTEAGGDHAADLMLIYPYFRTFSFTVFPSCCPPHV